MIEIRGNMSQIISQLITQQGTKNPLKVFQNIKSYKNLVDVNVAFLQGKISETPYHLGPINAQTIPQLTDLMKINKEGFLSIEGQPAMKVTEFISRTWRNQQGQQQGNWWYSIEQKPYISGFLPKKDLLSFVYFMKDQSDYYYQVIIHTTPSQLLFTTFPTSPYNVTRQKAHKRKQQLSSTPWELFTNIRRPDGHIDYRNDFVDFPMIYKLLEETVYVDIAGKNYNQGSVEQLLLQFYHSKKQQQL